MGDSYASGIAAGQPWEGGAGHENKSCNRFDGAYSVKLKDHNNVKATNFTFLSCSGSKSTSVERYQIPLLYDNTDLVTLTAGGNNVNWGDAVDGCVYRFKWTWSPDCNNALENTESLIRDDSNLRDPMTHAINSILGKSKKAKVYVTGYAKFWNAETTQCDSVTWNYWRNLPGATKMTRDLRGRMNNLVDLINGKLRDAVQRSSDTNRVFFVDYDSSYVGHRFCENGVIEPQEPGQDRSNTYLFQINTPVGALASNDEGFVPPTYPANQFYDSIVAAKATYGLLEVNPIYAGHNVSTDNTGQLPLWISKIFHPTSPGHIVIADAIANRMGGDTTQAGKPGKGGQASDSTSGPTDKAASNQPQTT
jgi:hypothetical protein